MNPHHPIAMFISCNYNPETKDENGILHLNMLIQQNEETKEPELFLVNPFTNNAEGVTKEDWERLDYKVLSAIPWEIEQLTKFLGYNPVKIVTPQQESATQLHKEYVEDDQNFKITVVVLLIAMLAITFIFQFMNL